MLTPTMLVFVMSIASLLSPLAVVKDVPTKPSIVGKEAFASDIVGASDSRSARKICTIDGCNNQVRKGGVCPPPRDPEAASYSTQTQRGRTTRLRIPMSVLVQWIRRRRRTWNVIRGRWRCTRKSCHGSYMPLFPTKVEIL